MDADECVESVHELRGQLWQARLNEAHQSRRLYEWISSAFHPSDAPCWLDDHTLLHGSYNAGLKLKFADGQTWLLRLPRVGKVHDGYLDEKVAAEVAAINLIRDKTTIPVPRIIAWGVSKENPLSLGPFILMEFIQGGVSLNDLLKETKNGTRILTDDITDGEIEFLYKQLANFLLQLFKLDFDHIGSLDSPNPAACSPRLRPLTWKVHDILQTGGVDTFGDRSNGFSSATEYFQYLAGQDLEQLTRQRNSVFGPYDASAKYRAFQTLKAIVPNFVHEDYSRTYKLICDDLGLANLMVKSREDLTVIGVVDLEWSYVGPAQLLGSAPWWLLMDRPTNPEWSYGDDSAAITARFLRYLDIFQRVLEEEEAKVPGYNDKELSRLVKWSRSSGAMWMHIVLSNGFNDTSSFPFARLIQCVGAEEWAKRCAEIDGEEASTFSARKVAQLDRYKCDLEAIEEDQVLVEEGLMSKEEFVAKHIMCLGKGERQVAEASEEKG